MVLMQIFLSHETAVPNVHELPTFFLHQAFRYHRSSRSSRSSRRTRPGCRVRSTHVSNEPISTESLQQWPLLLRLRTNPVDTLPGRKKKRCV